MKRALVLAGGGSKGAYEVGYIKALNEMNIDYQIVTGTSIGALNGCLLAQQDYDALQTLWNTLDINHVFAGEFDSDFSFDFDTMLNQSNLMLSFFKTYLKEKGADITPLKELLKSLLKEDKLLSSPIDFGLCTVLYPSLKPLFITKKEMEKDHILDYLIASASCFPVFPIHTFNEQSYIDGGYYDNLPIDLAFDMGADEVLVVDMKSDITHKHYVNRPHIKYTAPYVDLGSFLDFSKDSLERNKRIGYQTAMKAFDKLDGIKYTFEKFDTPLYQEFYKEVLYLERTLSSSKGESKSSLYNKYLEANKFQPLNEKEYLYITLDWIAEILNRDASYVYKFDIFVKDILKDFESYTAKEYQALTLSSTEELMKTFSDMSIKGIVGRLLHEMIYPQERKIGNVVFGSMFNKELVIAKLLYMLYHEKKAKHS